MSANQPPNVCPKCGVGLPQDAPQGLCPACVLGLAAAPTETEAGSGSSRHEPPPLERVRAVFPQLEAIELIGSGGMGAVYKARQTKLDRWVALKLLHPPLARQAAFAERFQREARILAKLNHPNIVMVFDFGEAGGFYFLLMEYVEGVNLREAMRTGQFTPAQALEVVPKVCEALQFAHEHGVLHRDIKPENILLDARGRVKIADFGIAKLRGEQREVALTASGAALGTPAYMAPEQIERPGDVDHRADIYSLGVVFYEMLTGELPLGRFAPPSQKTPLDARVDDIVLRALAKEREHRQQSAGEVKTQVESVASTPAPADSPIGVHRSATDAEGHPRPPAFAGSEPAPGLPLSPRTSWKAVTSAVLSVPLWLKAGAMALWSVVSLFSRDTALSWGGAIPALMFGGLLGLVGMVLGVLALGDIRRSGGRLQGTGLAIMGTLGIPYALAVILLPGLLLTFGGAGVIPPSVGRRLLEFGPLLLLGLLVVVVRRLKRWAEPAALTGPDRNASKLLAVGVAGGALLLLIVALLSALSGGQRAMPPANGPAGSSGEPRAVTGGFHLEFTLPAGQAAVFEVVTRRGREIVPLPKLGAYALAPAHEEATGTLRFERDPANDLPGLRRPWQLELRQRTGVSSIAGVDFPAAMATAIGSSSLVQWLRPEDEFIEWLHPGSDRQPAVGLRIRTRAHGRDDDEVNRGAVFNLGTNWPAGSAAVATAVLPRLDLPVEVPSHETFVVSAVLLSNGVPVKAGNLRARLWPPGVGGTNPYHVRWQALAPSADLTNSAPWELVIEDGTSQTIAARLRPKALPTLAWTLSPAAQERKLRTVSPALQTFEIARALQAPGGANDGAVDWSLRLQLQSSPVPPNSAGRGAQIDFVLPPHQVVTFEFLRRTAQGLEPVPNLAAFFVNCAAEEHTGKFVLAETHDDLDTLTGLPRWRFGLEGPTVGNVETGVSPTIPIPEDLVSGRHWSISSWRHLNPDSEVFEEVASTGQAYPSYALRIRTTAVSARPGVSEQSSGWGTNWLAVISAARAAPPAPTYGFMRVDLVVPRGQGAVIEVLGHTREGVQPLAGAAGYLLASAERDASSVFQWRQNPARPYQGGGEVPWQLTFQGEQGAVMAATTNLFVPEAMARLVPTGGWTLLANQLEPDSELLHWFVERVGAERPGLGIRLRTFAHGLGVVELSESGFAGAGTNWIAQFPPSVRTPPPEYRFTEIIPQASAEPDRQAALFRVPLGLQPSFECSLVTEPGAAEGFHDAVELPADTNAVRLLRLEWAVARTQTEGRDMSTWEVLLRDEETGRPLKRFAAPRPVPASLRTTPGEPARVREGDGHDAELLSGLTEASTNSEQVFWRLKLYYGALPAAAPRS